MEFPVLRTCPREEIRIRNKVRIKTSISKNDVRFVAEYPSEQHEQALYKYCCPICLRYFNLMLTSSCCKNYICRLCIGDMAKRAKRDREFIIRCAHCLEEDFKLTDVGPEETVKHYTDTPFKGRRKPSSSSYATPIKLIRMDSGLGSPYKLRDLDEIQLGLVTEEDTATKVGVKAPHHIGLEESVMEFESPAKKPRKKYMSERKSYDKENMAPEPHFSLKDLPFSLGSSASFVSEDIQRVTVKSISP